METQDGGSSHRLISMGSSIWNQTTGMKDEEWVVLERKAKNPYEALFGKFSVIEHF
jgi:hypothetical protein